MANSLPQWGRAWNGSSAASISGSNRRTAGQSFFQVKWMPITSCSKQGLSHNLSRATLRTSVTCTIGAIRSLRRATAINADGASRRGTKYSLCSSSPLLGVNSMRKCGNLSYHGPNAT